MDITIREGLGRDYAEMYWHVFKIAGDLLADKSYTPVHGAYAPFPQDYLIDAVLEYSAQPDGRAVDEQDINAAEAVVGRLFPVDHTLHTFTSETQEFLMAASKIYADARDTTSHLVEIDITNLRACNDAIGKAHTNVLMEALVGIFHDELSNAQREAGLDEGHNVVAVRSGGDEIRYIVTGLSEEQLSEALTKANNKASGIADETALAQLEHSKYQGDPTRAGVGAIGASVPLGDFIKDEEAAQKILDEGIIAGKKAYGEARENPTELIPARNYGSEQADAIFDQIKKIIYEMGNPAIEPSRITSIAQGDVPADMQQLLDAEHIFPDQVTGLRPGHGLPSLLAGTDHPQTVAVLSIGNLSGMNLAMGTSGANQIIRAISDSFREHFGNFEPEVRQNMRFYAQAGGRVYMHMNGADQRGDGMPIEDKLSEALFDFITEVDRKILGMEVEHDEKFHLRDFASIRDNNLTPIVQVSFADNIKEDGKTRNAVEILDILDEIIRVGELKFMGELHALNGKVINLGSAETSQYAGGAVKTTKTNRGGENPSHVDRLTEKKSDPDPQRTR